MHILPPNPVDFWLRRWFGGVVCPLMLTGYAIYSLATNHGYAIGRARFFLRGYLCFVEVTGFKATLMAVACMGFALALFSRYHAPYSNKFTYFAEYGEVAGLLLVFIGVCWCSWLLLTGN